MGEWRCIIRYKHGFIRNKNLDFISVLKLQIKKKKITVVFRLSSGKQYNGIAIDKVEV